MSGGQDWANEQVSSTAEEHRGRTFVICERCGESVLSDGEWLFVSGSVVCRKCCVKGVGQQRAATKEHQCQECNDRFSYKPKVLLGAYSCLCEKCWFRISGGPFREA